MKQLTSFLLIGLLLPLLMGFKSLSSSDFGLWKNAPCFKGLDFAVKRDAEPYAGKYKWTVKFRNRYGVNADFRYALVESTASTAEGRSNARISIKANSEAEGTYFYLAESNNVIIFVDKMYFNNAAWGTKNAPCDN